MKKILILLYIFLIISIVVSDKKRIEKIDYNGNVVMGTCKIEVECPEYTKIDNNLSISSSEIGCRVTNKIHSKGYHRTENSCSSCPSYCSYPGGTVGGECKIREGETFTNCEWGGFIKSFGLNGVFSNNQVANSCVSNDQINTSDNIRCVSYCPTISCPKTCSCIAGYPCGWDQNGNPNRRYDCDGNCR